MSLDNIKIILELYKKDLVNIDQAINLLAETITANAYQLNLNNNQTTWSFGAPSWVTTTTDESVSTKQE